MLGIIVPTYNRPSRVRSLYLQLKSLDLPITVVFVDAYGNVEDFNDDIFFVLTVSSDNFWGSSINLGFSFLERLDRNYQSILLLNDDLHISNSNLEQLYFRMRNHMVLAPLIMDLHNQTKQIFPGKVWSNLHLNYIDKFVVSLPINNFYTRDSLAGNCLLLSYTFCKSRKNLIDSDNFPHVFGDSALTIYAKRQGFEIGVYNDLLAYDDTSDREKNNYFKNVNKKSFSTIYNDIFFSKKSGMNLKSLFIFKISYSKSRFLGLISFFFILFRANLSIVIKYLLKK